jgi:hypothetical protein
MRRTFSVIALVLACILAVFSVDAIWVRNLVLNTDRFVEQLGPLVDNPDVQNALVDKVSSELESVADLDTRLKNRLPGQITFLTGPIDDAANRFIERVTRTVVTSEQFSNAWKQILRVTHQQMVKTLTGGGPHIKTQNGRITLDLTDLRNRVVAKLQSTGLDVFDKLPANKQLTFTVADSPKLAKLQNFVNVLKTTAWLLPLIAVALFALSVALARDHRRGLTRVGLGIAIGMAVHLIALALGRSFYLNIVTSTLPRDARASMFDLLVTAPRAGTRILLVIGLLIAIGSGLAGPSRAALWVRGGVGRLAGKAGGAAGTLDPVAATGRFVGAHFKVFVAAVIAIGVVIMLAIDQLTAKEVLWIGVGVGVMVVVLAILAASGRRGEAPSEGSPPDAPPPEVPPKAPATVG